MKIPSVHSIGHTSKALPPPKNKDLPVRFHIFVYLQTGLTNENYMWKSPILESAANRDIADGISMFGSADMKMKLVQSAGTSNLEIVLLYAYSVVEFNFLDEIGTCLGIKEKFPSLKKSGSLGAEAGNIFLQMVERGRDCDKNDLWTSSPQGLPEGMIPNTHL